MKSVLLFLLFFCARSEAHECEAYLRKACAPLKGTRAVLLCAWLRDDVPKNCREYVGQIFDMSLSLVETRYVCPDIEFGDCKERIFADRFRCADALMSKTPKCQKRIDAVKASYARFKKTYGEPTE